MFEYQALEHRTRLERCSTSVAMALAFFASLLIDVGKYVVKFAPVDNFVKVFQGVSLLGELGIAVAKVKKAELVIHMGVLLVTPSI